MATLTNTKINEVKHKILESHYFTLDDFYFEFPDNGYDLVRISFIPIANYFLIIQEEITEAQNDGMEYDSKVKNEFKVTTSPGNYKNEEFFHHNYISNAIHEISAWLYNIRDELQNITVDINEVTKEAIRDIKESLNQSFPNEKERFSSVEIEDISEKLSILQSQVNKLEDELKITKEENEKIQSIIEQSTENLSIYPKKAWYFTTLNKFKNINSDIKILLDVKDNISNLIDYFK